MASQTHRFAHPPDRKPGMYGRLAVMLLLSFVAMYALMYAMVDRPAHVHNNLNQVYMAALMAAPMVLIELALMGRMYPNMALNVGLAAAAMALMMASWFAIRAQSGIGDRQFVASMIPHHSGAILMCQRGNLADAELVRLCAQIIQSQQQEIEQMEAIRKRLAQAGR